MQSSSRRTLLSVSAQTAFLAGLGGWGVSPAFAQEDREDAPQAQRYVDNALATLKGMLGDANFPALRAGMKGARGVLIFPHIWKAGFIVGGAGGVGVLLVRGKDSWSQPAFYSLSAASVGLMIGGASAESVMLVNTQSAIDRMFASTISLGADVSIAAGPVGAGNAASAGGDVVSYSRSSGAFVGVSFSGYRLGVRPNLNQAYYGRPVTPVEILVKGLVKNPGADALRAALRAAS